MADKPIWIVRLETQYRFYHGALPQKRRSGGGKWWVRRGRDVALMYEEEFEKIFPKRFHLKPGGGPVKLEFT